MKIAITGARGFIGSNLVDRFRHIEEVELVAIPHDASDSILKESLYDVDWLFHLAGVNRPEKEEEFFTGNPGFTQRVINALNPDRDTRIVLSSSTQAEKDNPYGISKKQSEEHLAEYATAMARRLVIYRLPGVFGKWCRPNYNNVVATFCNNVAQGESLYVRDPDYALSMVYVDDVVNEWHALIVQDIDPGVDYREVKPLYTITLGDLSDTISSFKASRETNEIADYSDLLTKKLYTTYLSYLPKDEFSYPLYERVDNRGKLAEFIKSDTMGQIFISTTEPGITRGNHYHRLKVEKFCVLEGEAEVVLRHIPSDTITRYPVSGGQWQVIDIPPGWVHNIKNTGSSRMICLFWANEPFDQENPDTYYEPVES